MGNKMLKHKLARLLKKYAKLQRPIIDLDTLDESVHNFFFSTETPLRPNSKVSLKLKPESLKFYKNILGQSISHLSSYNIRPVFNIRMDENNVIMSIIINKIKYDIGMLSISCVADPKAKDKLKYIFTITTHVGKEDNSVLEGNLTLDNFKLKVMKAIKQIMLDYKVLKSALPFEDTLVN